MRISLCMITKNEEDFLAQCLESVKNLVYEIIVVDTGSIDRTKEVAKTFGAKVFDFKWINDFSSARNESLKHATGDFVLILDGDEVISKEDFNIIKTLCEKHKNELIGFSLIQRNYTNDGSREGFVFGKEDNSIEGKDYLGWSESKIVRLFSNNKKITFRGEIHELVEHSIKDNNGQIIHTNIPIHHYKEKKDNKSQEQKIKMYKEICENKIKNNPKNAIAYHELAAVYRVMKNYEKAATNYKEAIKLQNKFPEAKYGLGIVYNELQKYEKAIDYFNQAINDFSNYSDSYFNRGVSYAKLGQLDKAADSIFIGLKIKPNDINALVNLGGIFEKMKKYNEAKKALLHVLTLEPSNARAYYNLGVVFEKQIQYKQAIIAYERAIIFNYQNKEKLITRLEALKHFFGKNHY